MARLILTSLVLAIFIHPLYAQSSLYTEVVNVSTVFCSDSCLSSKPRVQWGFCFFVPHVDAVLIDAQIGMASEFMRSH